MIGQELGSWVRNPNKYFCWERAIAIVLQVICSRLSSTVNLLKTSECSSKILPVPGFVPVFIKLIVIAPATPTPKKPFNDFNALVKKNYYMNNKLG